MKSNQKTILITGCSTGIGRATADLLREHGYHVIATARKEADVAALKADGFDALILDLRDSDSIKQAVDAVLATDKPLYGLVNNAGYGSIGAVEDLSRASLQKQFETNVFGLVELSNLLLPHMRKHQSGRIVNISSVLGLVSFPFRGAYNASKFAVEALSDAMRLELAGSGIYVSLIEPGPIASQFRHNAREQFEKHMSDSTSPHQAHYDKMNSNFLATKKIPFTLPPEAVSKKILHALSAKKPKARYFVTIPTYLMACAKRILPTFLLDKLIQRIH